MDVSANTNPGSKGMSMEDGDGVWSPDIEEAFAEALQIYPPCGRRKIILSEEGKMYGRNELIARYIKMKTGKTRSRKQVSSHIQVLARKKQRELQSKLKENPAAAQQLAHTLSGLSSAEIVSSTITASNSSQANMDRMAMSFSGVPSSSRMQTGSDYGSSYSQHQGHQQQSQQSQQSQQAGTYNGIARLRLALDYFAAYVDYPMGNGTHHFVELNGSYHFADPQMEVVDIMQVADKFPVLLDQYHQGPREAFFLVKFWVDMTFDPVAAQNCHTENDLPPVSGLSERAFFGLNCRFESLECLVIEVSMTAIQLGKQVIEKIQVEEPVQDGGRYLYNMHRSPMCDYMTSFARRLRELDDIEMMNKVLENFHVTQHVRNQATGELLFSFACVFEVAKPGLGCGHHVYKLIDPHEEAMMRRYTA